MATKSSKRVLSVEEAKKEYELANNYISGTNGVEKNFDEGVKHLKIAANANYGDALIDLGNYYAKGILVVYNIEHAIECYEKAYYAGRTDAMQLLEKLKTSFIKEKATSDLEALVVKGVCYLTGKSLTKNVKTGLNTLARAALMGSSEAEWTLFTVYVSGQFLPPDYEEAFYWLEKSAEHGNVKAMSNLGDFYFEGKGVKQDMLKAVDWYTKAMEKGDIDAMFRIGLMYQQGLGVKKDETKGTAFWKIAAERGHVNAQINVAICYENGIGVPPHHGQALYYLRKAAAQGSAKAKKMLEDINTGTKL